MSNTKTKTKLLLGVILIFLCMLNINVITDRDNNSMLSLLSITRSAYADGEGESGPFYMEVCRNCELPYGQTGIELVCYYTGMGEMHCYHFFDCGYGYCDWAGKCDVIIILPVVMVIVKLKRGCPKRIVFLNEILIFEFHFR